MCYGLYGYQYRTAAEMEGLIDYFCRCAYYIKTLYERGRLSGIVLCGGFTNPNYPDVSEARTSSWHLLDVLRSFYELPADSIICCLEEQSFNTAQNIVFTGYLMTHRDPFTSEELIGAINNNPERARELMCHKENWHQLSHHIVFLCDNYRWLKVQMMVKLAKSLLQGFRLRVISFPRKDIHPNSSYLKQWEAAVAYLCHPTRFFKDLEVGQ